MIFFFYIGNPFLILLRDSWNADHTTVWVPNTILSHRIIIAGACLSPPWALAHTVLLWLFSHGFFFLLFQVIASKTLLLKGRLVFVIFSNDFPVRHCTGEGQWPRTPYLWCWGIWPWTEGDDVQQQQWGSDCRDGQGLGIKTEKNCVLWHHHCINPSRLYFV